VPQTLTAGTGVTITNGNGDITIAATGIGAGLYRQVMSATPTGASTGLAQWLNQGSATVSDSPVGVSVNVPSSGGSATIVGRYVAAPAAPYTLTVLVAGTRTNVSVAGGIGIGWYDGSAKLHLMAFGPAFLVVNRWNSVSSWNANDFLNSSTAFPQPLWMQLRDDGTNISFAISQDGANFIQVYSAVKSSSWLGSSGYSNLLLFAQPQGGQTLSTLMSWAVN
jgi:hypothetical protein